MSEKKYPTRMHEVLGVEPNEEFYINGDFGIFFLTKEGYLTSDNAGRNSNWIVHAINRGITRRPRLTEEQILALNAAVKWFGFKWLVKDKCESVCFWQNKPEKRENHWSAYGGGMYADIMTVKVDNLVSWSDPAPLDIVQVLRQNGEEVEGHPDPDTEPEGCWHCRNIEAHRIEYVIAVRIKGGTPMNTPDCPYHYCPACGRKLEVEG